MRVLVRVLDVLVKKFVDVVEAEGVDVSFVDVCNVD